MMKIFFKRPLYNIAGKISNLMKRYRSYEDRKVKRVQDEFWNNLFNNEKYFKYNLDKDIQINLYKDSILSRLIYEGFEKEETDFLQIFLNEGDTFIDIGANVGLFTLLAAKKVGSKGSVICFEPAPITFERLTENVELNNFRNIDFRNIGLSDEIGELTFHISDNGFDAWNSFAKSTDNNLAKSIIVPTSTLNFELKNVDKSKIKLIKIDVEGWEKFVLRGGRDLFIEFNPAVMVEFTEVNTFNAGYPVYEIYDLMESFGYSWYIIKDGNLVKEAKKIHYPYNNLIAMKNNSKNV